MYNSIVFQPSEYSSVWADKTTLTPPIFIEVPGPNRENDQYLCVGVIGFALFYDFSIGCWTVYCLSSDTDVNGYGPQKDEGEKKL